MLGDNGIYIKENIIMNKMLVVVDMQNDFIDGALGSPEAQAIVPKVVERIKEAINSREIIYFTKDTHFKEDYFSTEEGKNLPILHCLYGDKGWELHDDIIKCAKNNNYDLDLRTMYKHSFGCDFWELPPFINDVDQIEVIGLDTDFCIITNTLMLKTKFPNAHIIINAECCAGSTSEWHEKALDMLEHCHCEIINRE